MFEPISWHNDSKYRPPLSPACTQCAQGSKMVILITGICPQNCFYCPLSTQKIGRDVIFADEWQLPTENDLTVLKKEAQAINATGAGITGGDPLAVWQRTKRFITYLKHEFGNTFHIHLYTSGIINSTHITDLANVGLDEIRFHPLPKTWKNMNKSTIKKAIQLAQKTSLDVAIEIPVLPHHEVEILALIDWAEENNIHWINLNELEFSETNAQQLLNKGYHVKNEISAAVQDSQTTADNIFKALNTKDYSIGVHYCSVSFKDGIQLRNRITRRAHTIKKPYEIITEDGTLLKGIITSKKHTLNEIQNILRTTYTIPYKLIGINTKQNRIELPASILQDLATTLRTHNLICHLIEEYPTADHLEVERIPLP